MCRHVWAPREGRRLTHISQITTTVDHAVSMTCAEAHKPGTDVNKPLMRFKAVGRLPMVPAVLVCVVSDNIT
jgi:hypothetical protein